MICLCKTPAALLCPEHEQDGPELRGGAYEALAMMYLHALEDSKRVDFIESCRVQWTKTQMRVAFAYPIGLTLRKGIDASVERCKSDWGDDHMP